MILQTTSFPITPLEIQSYPVIADQNERDHAALVTAIRRHFKYSLLEA